MNANGRRPDAAHPAGGSTPSRPGRRRRSPSRPTATATTTSRSTPWASPAPPRPASQTRRATTSRRPGRPTALKHRLREQPDPGDAATARSHDEARPATRPDTVVTTPPSTRSPTGNGTGEPAGPSVSPLLAGRARNSGRQRSRRHVSAPRAFLLRRASRGAKPRSGVHSQSLSASSNKLLLASGVGPGEATIPLVHTGATRFRRGRSPAELQAEVPVGLAKQPGTNQ